MSTKNFTVTYDPIADETPIVEEQYIPNESPEGALEFFLADKGIEPEGGDDVAVVSEDGTLHYGIYDTDEDGQVILTFREHTGATV